MLDPISDMLTRIRNASSAGHPDVVVPMSRFKLQLAGLIQKNNFIRGISEFSDEGKKKMKIVLRYTKDEKGKKIPYIQGLRRVSRQGQRIYAKKGNIPLVKSGYGFAVISTSRGLMTDNGARQAGLGGEVICEIW
jgi:small subunit ribosomal protein S8